MRATLCNSKTDNFHKALTTLLCLKLGTGCNAVELRAFVESCARDAIADSENASSWNGIDVPQVGRVLRSWHFDSEFLTQDGQPRPLRSTGTSGLYRLVNKYFPPAQFTAVFKALKSNGLVRAQSRGFWVPTEQYARHTKVTAELLAYFGDGIARFADTVTQNLNSSNRSNLLFDRCARVKTLPKTQAAAFRRFAEEQATAFITTIDDWLERRCSERKKREDEQGCVAGVHTFAFLAESSPQVRSLAGASVKKT